MTLDLNLTRTLNSKASLQNPTLVAPLITFRPFDVSKYQDPLFVLLRYIVEVSSLLSYTFNHRLACAPRSNRVEQQAPDCDMALVHDNDLEFLVDEVRLFHALWRCYSHPGPCTSRLKLDSQMYY